MILITKHNTRYTSNDTQIVRNPRKINPILEISLSKHTYMLQIWGLEWFYNKDFMKIDFLNFNFLKSPSIEHLENYDDPKFTFKPQDGRVVAAQSVLGYVSGRMWILCTTVLSTSVHNWTSYHQKLSAIEPANQCRTLLNRWFPAIDRGVNEHNI